METTMQTRETWASRMAPRSFVSRRTRPDTAKPIVNICLDEGSSIDSFRSDVEANAPLQSEVETHSETCDRPSSY